jgi:hypothetical protein
MNASECRIMMGVPDLIRHEIRRIGENQGKPGIGGDIGLKRNVKALPQAD